MLTSRCRYLLRLSWRPLMPAEVPPRCLLSSLQTSAPVRALDINNAAKNAGASELEPGSSDEFGSLNPAYREKVTPAYQFLEDDDDEQDRHEAKISDIYRPGKADFLRRLNELVHEQKDLKRALEVFQMEMKEECVHQEQPHFRVMIHACAKAGYTRKAFELLREFRARNLRLHVGIFADLFLSCTNCHDKAYALNKATYLLNKLRADHVNPNRVMYNAMIQAFGRCGDLQTAFALVDEMKANDFELTDSTYSFLLQGCIQDKESGFRHALLVWRNMRRKKITPSIFNFNLMLRAAWECKLGAAQYTEDILLASLPRKKQLRATDKKMKAVGELRGGEQQLPAWLDIQIPPHQPTKTGSEVESGLTPPNLLSMEPAIENVLALNPEDTPQNRLLLMGGPAGLLDLMVQEHVQPDIKTLSILLQIQNSREAEDQLMPYLTKLSLTPDTAFFNQLIKMRAFRQEGERGVAALDLMKEWGVAPDILTFGCLALCCTGLKDALRLLADLRAFGSRPNLEIMSALMRNAAYRKSPRDMAAYLAIVQQERLTPDRRMLELVEGFYQTYRGWIRTKEAGGYVPYAVVLEMRADLAHWRPFAASYRDWLGRTPADVTADPWDQYTIAKDVERRERKAKNAREK